MNLSFWFLEVSDFLKTLLAYIFLECFTMQLFIDPLSHCLIAILGKQCILLTTDFFFSFRENLGLKMRGVLIHYIFVQVFFFYMPMSTLPQVLYIYIPSLCLFLSCKCCKLISSYSLIYQLIFKISVFILKISIVSDFNTF